MAAFIETAISEVQTGFTFEQNLLRLDPLRVGYAAIDRTHCRALRLLVKAHALGTLVGYDVIKIVGNGLVFVFGIHHSIALEGVGTAHRVALRNGPLHAALVDGVVGAFGFASTAVDALVGDHDGHSVVSVCFKKMYNSMIFKELYLFFVLKKRLVVVTWFLLFFLKK
jgi:hypothetical protein